MSGWYIANILIGGIIGFIVDAADGAMFNQSPSQIHAILKTAAAAGLFGQDTPQDGQALTEQDP